LNHPRREFGGWNKSLLFGFENKEFDEAFGNGCWPFLWPENDKRKSAESKDYDENFNG
jgi:hypothetical protein